jgi:alpha-amylase
MYNTTGQTGSFYKGIAGAGQESPKLRGSAKLWEGLALIALMGQLISCTPDVSRGFGDVHSPFFWENANIYFLLTDRFFNGDPTNDLNFDRSRKTAVLRGFEGGDLNGVIRKLEEGYFTKLGVTALWITPFFEQDHGATDESTGITYGYHGYWIQDWTRLDPNFGTEAELQRLVESAHSRGIRVVMDVVMNHTGPVTGLDPVWPPEWVRTGPVCTFKSYETTVSCTLVKNLPDIRTGSDQLVELPGRLLEKWAAEGRLDQELAELDVFFKRTGYPRAPRYYLIKWLTDYIQKYGIDGYRLDTAKHIEEQVWAELLREARTAYLDWKTENPDKVLDNNDFYMVGEVFGYGISSGRDFSFGDRKVDFFDQGIHSLINFEFKKDAKEDYEKLFSTYSGTLHLELGGHGILNYISSHDDLEPFDKMRERPMEALTKLLLAPGACQLYYGDESCRVLTVPGASGDANLRSMMNWEEIESDATRNGFPVREVMEHARKLGRFRRAHPAVGAGIHRMISSSPYVFSRTLVRDEYEDRVIVGLDMEAGTKTIRVDTVFREGERICDYYSGEKARVHHGTVRFTSDDSIVLLGL